MDCKILNEQGLIPGPTETEEAFCKRIERVPPAPEFLPKPVSSKGFYDAPRQQACDLFGIAPDWLPLVFSNKKLPPWQAACTWIGSTPPSATLQLRARFQEQDHYLFYSRDEIIAHEMAHAGRLAYDEPRFEEIFAYQTSPSSFHRTFGPLVQRPYETVLFLLLLLPPLFFPLLLLLPTVLVVLATLRLVHRRRQLARAHATLEQITPHAAHLLYRLTDREIAFAATHTPEEVRASCAADPTFRWHFLRKIYC